MLRDLAAQRIDHQPVSLRNPFKARLREVAEVAITALESASPLPRYRIGAEAEFLIGASLTKSDREIDVFILDIYHSSPVD